MDKNRLKNIIAEEVDRVLQQESGLNELSKLNENKYRDVSDKFKDALDRLPDKAFTTKNIEKLIKKMREKRPDAAMAYTKDAFGWLMKESINEDYSQRARNFRVALRRRLEKMKPGQVIRYGKLFWTAQGKNNFRDSLRNKTFPNGRMTPGQDVVQALKFAVQSDIMKHRGAAGDDMVKKYLKFEGKLNEAKEYRAGDTVKLKTGETVKINQVVKGPRPQFNTYRAKVKGKQVDFDLTVNRYNEYHLYIKYLIG